MAETHPRVQVLKSIMLHNEEKVAIIWSFADGGMMSQSLTFLTNSSLCGKTLGRVWMAPFVENSWNSNGSS